ncbi:rod shape-determining protein MreB [Pseudidiomarina aestuarii]|uniref:Rod shape-determining protein MreB n=1 Tax=Pseudidiomarina aestuarii TaxID=624146 RepID=A0A6N4DBP3_9GAMM|nr:rod shape-determining protein MreB [Pseudidiomarina aestuarii]
MFKFLRGLFSDDLVVELSENRITFRKIGTSEFIEIEPWIALQTLKGKVSIESIGAEARSLTSDTIQVINPFSHPRCLVANFGLAEKILQHGLFTFHNSKLRAAPRVVMHQLEKLEGGLTDIEERVLRELALGMGAREVLIHTGERLNLQMQTFGSLMEIVHEYKSKS